MLTITKELESLCKKYIPRYADKITTLYYGVKAPVEFFNKKAIQQQRNKLGFSADNFIIGLIGRLEQSKGQHLLIEAIRQAKDNKQTISGLIIGHEMNPGYRDQLKQQAISLGVQKQIKFQDFVNQPQQLMQLCDVIVLASEQETFGLVLVEAMRAGVTVIGSNSGGVPEIIQHKETGLLFDRGSASSLYRQIECLYLDEKFKTRLAKQGKYDADKRFNHNQHFLQLEQHFKSLLHSTI